MNILRLSFFAFYMASAFFAPPSEQPKEKASTQERIIESIYVKQVEEGVQVSIKGSNLRFKTEKKEKEAVLTFPEADISFPYNQILVDISPIKQMDIRKIEKDIKIFISLSEQTELEVLPESSLSNLQLIFRSPRKNTEKRKNGQSVKISIKTQKEELLMIATSEEKLEYDIARLSFPNRFVIKLKNVFVERSEEHAINQPPVKRISILPLSARNLTQITIHLEKKIEPKITQQKDGKQLTIAFALEKKEEREQKEVLPTEKEITEKKEEPSLVKVEVKKEKSYVVISATGTTKLKFKTEKLSFPTRFVIKLKNSFVKESEEHDIQRPPVKRILVKTLSALNLTQITIHMDEMKEPEITSEQDGKQLVLKFPVAEKKVELKELTKLTTTSSLPSEKKEKESLEDTAKHPSTELEKEKAITSSPYANITDITVQKPAQRVIINITGNKVLAYKAKLLQYPPKILLEIFQSKLPFPKKEIVLKHGAVRRARIYQQQISPVAISRVVVDLAKPVSYEISPQQEGKKLVLNIQAPPVPDETKPQITVAKPSPKAKKKESFPLPSIYAPSLKKRVVNMEFKDATVEDMIRVLAEMAGLNVFIVEQDLNQLQNLTGRGVTMRLVDMPVEQALDMLITTSNLAWRIVGNTLIIASDFETVNRVGSTVLSGDFQVETFSIPGYTRSEFTEVLKQAVPEVTVIETAPDRPQDQITILGPPNSLKRVRRLIASLKPQPEVLVETFDLEQLSPDDVEEALKTAVPEAKIISKKTSPNLISVSGSKFTLERVKAFLGSLNLQPVITYRTVNVQEVDPEELQKLLKKVLPSVDIVRSVKGFASTSVTLSGTENDLERAQSLIESLEGGADKSTMAKAVEVVKLKYLDTLSALQETENFDLVQLIKDAVPGIEKSGGSITFDTRNNAVIIKGTPADVERARKFIKDLDQPLPQVLIEVQIVDLNAEGSRAFSSSLVHASEKPGENIKETHPPGLEVSSESGEINFSFNMLRAGVDLFLQNLVKENKARVLATPRVATISGKQAEISIRQIIPFTEEEAVPKTSPTGGEATVVVRRAKTQEIEISLKITPRVHKDNTITLDLQPTVQVPSGGPTEEGRLPINERTVRTLMRIKNGESVVIGGLINSKERETLTKIPFLSNLPLIGKLFTSHSRESSDAEMVMIVTAKILKS